VSSYDAWESDNVPSSVVPASRPINLSLRPVSAATSRAAGAFLLPKGSQGTCIPLLVLDIAPEREPGNVPDIAAQRSP
jgi:hypothetical protein